jgi:hypothetical protein
MTLGPRKESYAMKHVPDRTQDPERPRSLEELRCRLNRRRSDLIDGWRRCANPLCRREKQCCGESPDLKCADDGSPPRTFSREETAKVMSDLYKEVKRRCAEYAAGAEPPDPETLRKLRDKARAAARRRRKSAQAGAAKTAAQAAQVAEPPSPVAEETQLAPEKQERTNRAWNDTMASLPAEQESDREPPPRFGPRIRAL